MRNYILIFCTLGLLSGCTQVEKSSFLNSKNAYLGLVPPDSIPVPFAPGIVSTDVNNHSPAIFSQNGNELFWSYYDDGEHAIMHMEYVKGGWTTPAKFIFGDEFKDGNPFFSKDWNQLFFHSARKGPRADDSLNITFWSTEKSEQGWTTPKQFDFLPQFSQWQIYGCQTADGDFYFTSKSDIQSRGFQLHYARFNGHGWDDPELMPAVFNASTVNWTPYVSPDESYLIFSSDRDGDAGDYNGCDLFISFRNPDQSWNDPIPLSDEINTDVIERFPWMSPDGKYLFFVRGFGDVYWVDAGVIAVAKLMLESKK
ncbi:PD40 domain-containing protein [bacterium]|nr:PD40 domain-containing protein [bacterium]